MSQIPKKFRVWNKENKKMLYQRNEWFLDNEYDILGFPFGTGGELECGGEDKYEIMQFTGLLDKLGKEIYEGDIIKIAKRGGYEIIEIQWNNELTGWEIWKIYQEFYEVIGNIWENPQSLK